MVISVQSGASNLTPQILVRPMGGFARAHVLTLAFAAIIFSFAPLVAAAQSTEDLAYALTEAIRDGNADEITALIRQGADVNIDQGQPLSSAVQTGHLDIVTALLAGGANPNGGNALIYASMSGQTNIV